jgi:integrase
MLKASISERADAPAHLDRRGFKRSPAATAGYRAGEPPLNKGLRFPAEPLTPAECYALIDACEGRARLRNRALILLLWRSGLRIGEALALRPKDVELERGRITVLHGKGDRRRVVAIDASAGAAVTEWELRRHELGVGGGAALFCVITAPTVGYPLNDMYVRELLKRLARKAGVEKRVHPHGFRHTYAAYLLEEGVPVHYIRRMLGHSSLEITERYCDHLSPVAALERVAAVRWP